MPPRKRAAAPAKPEPEAEQEVDEEQGDQREIPEPDEPETKESDIAPPEPAKSDLQSVEEPCPACFPSGWPDLAFAVGCEHGTWIRT